MRDRSLRRTGIPEESSTNNGDSRVFRNRVGSIAGWVADVRDVIANVKWRSSLKDVVS